MFKNKLFTKMIVAYFCIIMSTLAVLGVLLSFLLNNYFIYNKQTEMLVKAEDISDMVKSYLIGKQDPGPLIELLNRAEKKLGTEIWVIDRNGYVIAASAGQRVHEGNVVEPADILEMQEGKAVFRQGDSSIYKEKVLWVIIPVETPLRVIGGVILYSPVIGVTQTITKVRNLFLYSAVVSILFSTIVVYFLSKYVTGPLGNMNRVAKQLARGNFSERVQVKQGDELGDLGASFNYMADQIEKQEKMRRDFVADVSHELRSPLTNIQGFIEAMLDRKDKTEEDRVRYLGILHKETLRLTRLVSELLDLSRMESGVLPVARVPVDFNAVIDTSVLKLKPSLDEKSLHLVMNNTGVKTEVLGDRDRLEQVLTNLLDNAVRFSPPGGRLVISITEKEGFLEVTVQDEGEGISPEELPLIWERFYKVDKSRCREQGGTGLGLAIVRRIIESMGGRVRARSIPGQGTEIGFSLPLAVE